MIRRRRRKDAAAAALPGICASSRIIVTCGTGGVGKTSCAAAIGVIGARLGRRVVVLTIDPARRLADAVGLSGAIANEPVRIDAGTRGELWFSMLDVKATFDALVADAAGDAGQAERILSNTFYRGISHSLSGTRDYMAAERVHSFVNDPRFDLVVVDTPPTRGALDFLESPERLARFLQHPVVRVLVAQGRGGMRLANIGLQPVVKAVGKIVGSDTLAGAVAFLQAFDGMEADFRRRALEVAGLLRGAETTFAVVVAPSAGAADEAAWFVAELDRLGIDLGLVIENRVPPSFDDSVAGTFPGLVSEARAAEGILEWFRDSTDRRHGAPPRVRAHEAAGDISDLAGIIDLADELSAPPGAGPGAAK